MNPSPRSPLLLLTLVLGLGLLLPPAAAAGESQSLQLSDGTITVTVTYESVLVTNENFQFDLLVDWNSSTQEYVLTFAFNGQLYTKSLRPSEARYAQVVNQNTFDTDALNTPVNLTLKRDGQVVAQGQAVIDINFEQANDLLYLYLGYTLIWAGVFGYLVFLHRGQERLSAKLQRLMTHHDQKGSSAQPTPPHDGERAEASEDGD